jgi:hypothetical protein
VLRLLDQEGTIHILAKDTGSSIKVVNKDGRARLMAP